MTNLVYSQWHRTLGYSYFAMDIDYIEIRNDLPIALIEVSTCTSSIPTCEGPHGVFNRFLKETGGFQFEVSWWVAKWLEIPAYVVCMDNNKNRIHILSLNNGNSCSMSTKDYYQFIALLEDLSLWKTDCQLNSPQLSLEDLVRKLALKYPGIKRYPYFKDRAKWQRSYEKRLREVSEREIRRRRQSNDPPPIFPVKKETTGERPDEYDKLRSAIPGDFFNLQWVEWRKDERTETIGRPAAILKTVGIKKEDWTDSLIVEKFNSFVASKEHIWWSECARRMAVRFYLVYFETINNGSSMGNKFVVFTKHKGDYVSKTFSTSEYRKWIASL